MAYDPAATKARLLDAAYDEFAQRGLAGARIERIAGAAGTNKQAIYFHFGSKEQLFDAVLATRCDALINTVPFNADDLPGYAAGVFDYLLEHPALMRMTMWQQLERPEATQHEAESYASTLDELAERYRHAAGTPADARLHAGTLMMLTMAIATAWTTASPALRTGDPKRLRRHLAIHRRAVIDTVAAMTATLTDEQ